MAKSRAKTSCWLVRSWEAGTGRAAIPSGTTVPPSVGASGSNCANSSPVPRGCWRRSAESRGARELLRLGLHDDIQFAADLDRFDIIPRLETDGWRIEAA